MPRRRVGSLHADESPDMKMFGERTDPVRDHDRLRSLPSSLEDLAPPSQEPIEMRLLCLLFIV